MGSLRVPVREIYVFGFGEMYSWRFYGNKTQYPLWSGALGFMIFGMLHGNRSYDCLLANVTCCSKPHLWIQQECLECFCSHGRYTPFSFFVHFLHSSFFYFTNNGDFGVFCAPTRAVLVVGFCHSYWKTYPKSSINWRKTLAPQRAVALFPYMG